jgi:hypothetical protein
MSALSYILHDPSLFTDYLDRFRGNSPRSREWLCLCCDCLAMITLKRLIVGLVIGSVASTVFAEGGAPSTRKGTSVLHYMTRNALTTTSNALENTAGSLRLQDNVQGKSAKQTLDLSLTGLEANAAYTLLAVVGDAVDAVPVGTFSTDSKGAARVSYSGKGKKAPLPASLDPLTDLRAISIENASTQSVAFAWIDTAESFQYLVKRNLTPADTATTESGSVSLKSNGSTVNFRLIAGGLVASNNYSLALNSNVVSTASADGDGGLTLTEWPVTAPAILDLRLLQLLDGSSNAVLSLDLPQ